MIKLEKALKNLGLTKSFYDELKAELDTEKLVADNGLIASSKEDVTDEVNQLDAEIEKADETDESEVDMKYISPTMKGVYK